LSRRRLNGAVPRPAPIPRRQIAGAGAKFLLRPNRRYAYADSLRGNKVSTR
jgi:hypothetical protein